MYSIAHIVDYNHIILTSVDQVCEHSNIPLQPCEKITNSYHCTCAALLEKTNVRGVAHY